MILRAAQFEIFAQNIGTWSPSRVVHSKQMNMEEGTPKRRGGPEAIAYIHTCMPLYCSETIVSVCFQVRKAIGLSRALVWSCSNRSAFVQVWQNCSLQRAVRQDASWWHSALNDLLRDQFMFFGLWAWREWRATSYRCPF